MIVPPLKNVPEQRMSGTQNSEAVAKKPNKTVASRPPRELDSNGNPVRKSRPKRVPRPIEEVCIYFRVCTLREKLSEKDIDAGFMPTPP